MELFTENEYIDTTGKPKVDALSIPVAPGDFMRRIYSFCGVIGLAPFLIRGKIIGKSQGQPRFEIPIGAMGTFVPGAAGIINTPVQKSFATLPSSISGGAAPDALLVNLSGPILYTGSGTVTSSVLVYPFTFQGDIDRLDVSVPEVSISGLDHTWRVWVGCLST